MDSHHRSVILAKPKLILLKKKLFFLLFSLISSGLFAQLQNESFEEYSSLPTNTGQFSRAIGWSNAASTYATPDYYHYLANESADIPQTPMGIVNAPDGNAVMGFCATGESGTNFREYISTQFTEPLEVGKTYTFAFRISNGAKTEVATSGLGTSKLGAHFSVDPIVQSGTDPVHLIPTFRIDTVVYTASWHHIIYTFTPTQPFNYLTMGVFFDDEDITIEEKEGPNALFAYYFVDDFYLRLVPENYDPTHPSPGKNDGTNVSNNPVLTEAPAPFFVPNSFTPNGDGKNDVFKPVPGTTSDWQLNIYSHWGEKLFSTDDESIGWDGIFNGVNAANGCYVWEVLYQVYDDEQGLISKSERGIFQLIR